MSVAIATARPTAPRSHAPRRRSSRVWALARAEGRRLVRHPIVLVSVPFCVVTFVLMTWYQAPVLSRDDILMGLALSPLAGAVFLAAHLGATRSYRHGTDELYEGTVTTSGQRTAGHLLSVLWAAGLSLVLVGAAVLYLVALHAVGRPDPLELLTGPSLVVLGGALGIALARWWRAALAGPVGVVALAALEIFLVWQTQAGRSENNPNPLRWLAPWVPIAPSGDPPRELVIRPSGWHLAFILSLAVVAGGIALLRAGIRPTRVAATAGALALLVVAGSAQVRVPTAAQRRALADYLVHPDRYQVCETRLGVQYCAYRAYAGWIDRWAAAVTPVIERVPAGARPRDVRVLQTLIVYGSDVAMKDLAGSPAGAQFGYNPTQDDLGSPITPGNRWGRGKDEGQDELAIDLVVAAQAVGLPRRPQDIRLTAADVKRILRDYPPEDLDEAQKQIRPGAVWDTCSSDGQARAVVALWLAGQATPRTEAMLRELVRRDPYGLVVGESADEQNVQYKSGQAIVIGFNGRLMYDLDALLYRLPVFNFVVRWGNADAHYAIQLLDRPRARVTQALARNWSVLVRPSTTSDELVQLLGLRPLPTYEQQLEGAGLDPASAEEFRQQEVDSSQVPCR